MEIEVVEGDITAQQVDAVVNAANRAMRGGGGVDGAIHRAGGPAVLEDCVRRFPNGLATGDAGWTTAGDMPARWVIHVVGPNRRAGQTDRGLLTSCYVRALEVADELGARSVAFPLVSAGVYGWDRDDAIACALEVFGSADTRVEEVRMIAFGREAYDAISRGDYAAAASAYRTAIAQDPRDDLAVAGLAQANLLGRLQGKTLDEIRNRAASAPDDLDAQLDVADLDLSGGHVDDAFARLLDLFPKLDAAGRNTVRERLLELFQVVGVDDPRVNTARQRLAMLLY